MTGRVVVEYVCRRRQHRLAEVVATTGGRMVLRPVRVPLLDVGRHPGRVRTHVTAAHEDDVQPVDGEPFWSIELACACGVEFPLVQDEVREHIRDGVRRVVLDAKR